jgi:hypothetical protein
MEARNNLVDPDWLESDFPCTKAFLPPSSPVEFSIFGEVSQ